MSSSVMVADGRKQISMRTVSGWDRTVARLKGGADEAKGRIAAGNMTLVLDKLGLKEDFTKVEGWLRNQPLTKEAARAQLEASIREHQEEIQKAQEQLKNVDSIVVPDEVIKMSGLVESFSRVFFDSPIGFPDNEGVKKSQELAKQISELSKQLIKDEDDDEEEEEEVVGEVAAK